MNDYRLLQNLKKIPLFLEIMRKLTISSHDLLEEEKTYILSCAIILIKKYETDLRFKSFVELAYYIILKYSLIYNDYEPLYDFSVNFGFYPISNAIEKQNLIQFDNITTSLISNQIQKKYNKNGIIVTLEQNNTQKKVINSSNNEICYVAPTSFGKSSLIVEHIKTHWNDGKRIGIIVPTKSLLMQTYRTVREAKLDVRILIHDEMYNGEKYFVAVFTQERALRLLDKQNELSFDILYIDEAHRLFDRDPRSILLSRLIRLNRNRNSNAQVIYLSPLISNMPNLSFDEHQKIFEQRIKFNIKEPEYFEYRTDNKIYMYNRFIDSFFEIGECSGIFEYIHKYKTSKTFCYLYSPKKIEIFADRLAKTCETISSSKEIEEVIQNLSTYVHQDFLAIEYLKKGIVYLHGIMPDNIKEYLEFKFCKIPEIQFLVANRVVLEGMNFPIDSLFIFNGKNLNGKELTNLIGRVNRLDQIFGKEQSLTKLMPKIHFVNSDEYNRKDGRMENKIRLLKKSAFEDNISNPLLKNYDKEKEKSEEIKNKCLNIIRDEECYFAETLDPIQILKQRLIALGLNSVYSINDDLCNMIYKRMQIIKDKIKIFDIHFLDVLSYVFVKNTDNFIIDNEFARLKNEKAISYYKMFFEHRKKSMKEKISNEVNYFEKRKNEKDYLLYIGETYGEVPYKHVERKTYRNVYIDLNQKSKKQLVNIAIIKLKLEEDFISYKLNKFFQLMYDYQLLSVDEYHKIVYGTTNLKKINLVKLGLNINIINRLEEDNQLKNVLIDSDNNLYVNYDFENYKKNADDYYRFELDKFL